MKNKITDMRNHLFAQLERLGDEDLTGEALNIEIERGKAIASISTQIINADSLQLKAFNVAREAGMKIKAPALLAITDAAGG